MFHHLTSRKLFIVFKQLQHSLLRIFVLLLLLVRLKCNEQPATCFKLIQMYTNTNTHTQIYKVCQTVYSTVQFSRNEFACITSNTINNTQFSTDFTCFHFSSIDDASFQIYLTFPFGAICFRCMFLFLLFHSFVR